MLNFNNSFCKLPNNFFDEVKPAKMPSPKLILPPLSRTLKYINGSFINSDSGTCAIFSNSVLFDTESIRSLHPIYSFAGYGKAIIDLFTNLSNSSFGEGSVFEKLYEINAKMLFINLNNYTTSQRI